MILLPPLSHLFVIFFTIEPFIHAPFAYNYTFLELVDEVINEIRNLVWPLLVDEVTDSFHHNNVFKKRNRTFKTTLVYVVLDAWGVVR